MENYYVITKEVNNPSALFIACSKYMFFCFLIESPTHTKLKIQNKTWTYEKRRQK